MSVTYKDIDELSQKSSVAGTEKIVVSDTEYITPGQIAGDTEKFFFVQGSSSAAGNGTSGEYLSTKWEGTVPGITTPVNGMKIAYRIATNTGVGTAGAVLSIDGGTTYKPVVFNVNSVITTRYGVGSTLLMTYNSTQTASAYLTSNKKTTVTGCWQIMDYSASNTDTKVRQYQSGSNEAGTSPKYPLLARYALTNVDGTYEANYSRFHTGATVNTSTGEIEAASFKKTGGTSSQFLKADGSVDSNTYATTSQIPSVPVTDVTVGGSSVVSSGTAVIPAIPSAPGTLITNATTTQSASSGEAMSGTITLHKVSKTGTYSDLIGTPTIPTVNNSTITVQMNGGTVDSFTTNAAAAKTINLGTVITAHQDISGKENTSNKVTSLSSSSTNTQYPSALCVYNLISGLTEPFGYSIVSSLPTASASTMGIIYVVTDGSSSTFSLTVASSGTYSWATIGTLSTSITTITNGEIDSLF